METRSPEAWKARSYAVRDRYDGLVFDRGLRGEGAASRVLGVGHILVDIALDEARELSVRAAEVEGIDGPVLVVSVEDEVTGTGSLVHRLIFGISEAGGRSELLRDWELLLVLNRLRFKHRRVEPVEDVSVPELTATVERLATAFAATFPAPVPAFRRPISWPEVLLIPVASRSHGREPRARP